MKAASSAKKCGVETKLTKHKPLNYSPTMLFSRKKLQTLKKKNKVLPGLETETIGCKGSRITSRPERRGLENSKNR